jgi:UDP-N-acetylmuramate dehydrogenase
VTPEPGADLDRVLSFLGPRLLRDHPLGPLTTYRVGGNSLRFVEVADASELGRIAAAVAPLYPAVPVLAVGRGSNLLVADAGFAGLALQLGEGFAEVRVDRGAGAPDGALVVAGAAASLPVVARRTVAAGLAGFEWAVGVPGSIGGAVRMNAGGHGSDMAASVRSIRVVDLSSGEDVVVEGAALGFGYRSSSLRASQVVVSATLALAGGEPAEGQRQLAEIVRWRRDHQPGGQNAGSVFTNPEGDSAGRLIDEAGCKGLRIGSAEVSTKHANFIQADAAGSADDVHLLMGEVVRRVQDHSGVRLHPETVLVGFDDSSEWAG